MPRTAPTTLPPAQLDQLRAETEAVRERIWQRAQHWALVLLTERVQVRHG